MILLRPDCLVFELSDGQLLPCSAETMALELIVEIPPTLQTGIIRDAACAVVHYFRTELGRSEVSVGEFAAALRKVLHGFGFDVEEIGDIPSAEAASSSPAGGEPVALRRSDVDLAALERACGGAGELGFYQHLRSDLQDRLKASPELLVYRGLRDCTMRLCSSRRWSGRCQLLSEEILDYLRACLRGRSPDCLLCVHR